MKIDAANYFGGRLLLVCSAADGLKFAYNFKPGDYEIVPAEKKKKRRSNDANAYAWVLIHQIAAKLRIPPIDVYRNAILNTGGVTESVICIAEEAAEQFRRSWESGHLGRQVQQFPSNRKGFVNLIVIYGSSDYDTAQMARFIDGLVQDAKELGIETEDPGKIQSLLDSWESRR
jgi:hypothetical protein